MSDMETTDSTRQLTIRLSEGTISELESLAGVLQKTAPPGIVFTRTDALRSAIMKGISSLRAAETRKKSGR